MFFEICLKSRYDSTDWTAAPSQGIHKEHYKCRHNLYRELESTLPSEQWKAAPYEQLVVFFRFSKTITEIEWLCLCLNKNVGTYMRLLLKQRR
jgi:hypothetical protein